MKDYLSVYMSTGRKINIMQNEKTEANLYTKDMGASTKTIPSKENPNESRVVTTSPYVKLVSQSKCPKYNGEN
jgi:hypothetical protein